MPIVCAIIFYLLFMSEYKTELPHCLCKNDRLHGWVLLGLKSMCRLIKEV
jgi:hypothetical protein